MPEEHDIDSKPQEAKRDEHQGRRGVILVSQYDGHEDEEGVQVVEEEAHKHEQRDPHAESKLV